MSTRKRHRRFTFQLGRARLTLQWLAFRKGKGRAKPAKPQDEAVGKQEGVI